MIHSSTDLFIMFVIMILSGLLSTMNVWVNQWSHMRLSLNDLYMTLLMTGWMFVFMGLFYQHLLSISMGIVFVGISLFCIRTQRFVTPSQYLTSMIPHHSMAIFMTNKVTQRTDLPSNETFKNLLRNIQNVQEKEIETMIQLLKD